MDNQNLQEPFKNVDITKYTKQLLDSGQINLEEIEKVAEVKARPGIIGEEIISMTDSGLEETRNVVTTDKNGHPGMVVTNPDGEQYIVSADTFNDDYEADLENPGFYKPKGKPIISYQINENIQFKAPWGENMKIEAGGRILINPDDLTMYGIQKSEDEMYKIIGTTNQGTPGMGSGMSGVQTDLDEIDQELNEIKNIVDEETNELLYDQEVYDEDKIETEHGKSR